MVIDGGGGGVKNTNITRGRRGFESHCMQTTRLQQGNFFRRAVVLLVNFHRITLTLLIWVIT